MANVAGVTRLAVEQLTVQNDASADARRNHH
jgi:hypothetical protein